MIMRPLSPSPSSPIARHRMQTDESHSAYFEDDSTARSSSVPPRGRVAFAGISAPCSSEFQKSLNDLRRQESEENNSVENKLVLPVIERLRHTERAVSGDVAKDRHRLAYSDDDLSGGSTISSSEEDINTSWTSLRDFGTITTVKAKNGRRARSEYSVESTNDDCASIRSDSHLITTKSPRSQRKLHDGNISASRPAAGRLSRKDENALRKSLLEPPAPNAHTRRLSPLSRPQTMKDSIHQSRSANSSPELLRRHQGHYTSSGHTGSAPTSPQGSPQVHRHGTNPNKRAHEIQKWQKPFNLSTSTSPDRSNVSINPFITRFDELSLTGHHRPRAATFNGGPPHADCVTTRRLGGVWLGLRANKDAWRLSDLSPDAANRPSVNLEEEFKRLKDCRYLRGHQSDEEVLQ